MKRRAWAIGLSVALLPLSAPASELRPGNVAVLYPDIGEPYRSVFAAIVNGIDDQARGRVVPVQLTATTHAADVSTELKRKDVKVVIALGRAGINAAARLERTVSVVAGGVIAPSDPSQRDWPVLSLAPDPALLFARLRALVPGIRRIWVVHDPRQNDWLIRLARDAARSQGLELLVFEAQDLKSAVRQYREVFANADAKRDALWLPQDASTVDDTVVLPMVLEECWGRGLTVFSSSVAHVKRGVLFALYPDNAGMGRALGRLAQAYVTGDAAQTAGIQPLRDVLLAVNTRTAHHLGVELDVRRTRFDMIFPEP
ncbi:MAG TPA: ABC transporter substrate binding protein [Aquabacterium sp.]|nr:ABC transporter substrate binding protein [Aquabacterium sp.]